MAALAGPEAELRAKLQKLRESLVAFRSDADALFTARRRCEGSRRRLRDACARRPGVAAAAPTPQAEEGTAESPPPASEAAAAQPTVAEPAAVSSEAPAPQPEVPQAPEPELERRSIGITGVGRLTGDSPQSKGGKKQHQQLEALGGEEAVLDLIADYFATGAVAGVAAGAIRREAIQDVWVDDLVGDTARISALYLRDSAAPSGPGLGVGLGGSPGLDCRQFRLFRLMEGHSWHVEAVLEPKAEAEDECEASYAVLGSSVAPAVQSVAPPPLPAVPEPVPAADAPVSLLPAALPAASAGAKLAAVRVRVLAGYALLNKDSGLFGDVSDPYVVVRVGGQEYRTPTINNDLNPTWTSGNEYSFPLDGSSTGTLRLEVFNSNTLRKDQSLGWLEADLASIDADEAWHRRRHALQGGGGGEIEFEVFGEAQVARPEQTAAGDKSPGRRKVPLPLTELPGESWDSAIVIDRSPEAVVDADTGPNTLADALRFGLEIAEAAKTPRALFDVFSTPSAASAAGPHAVISRQGFSRLVAMYGGRSPAAQGGDLLSQELFDELAITVGDGPDAVRGVPFDLFCAEFCPERAPDAVLRVSGRRRALIAELKSAVNRSLSPSQARLRLFGASLFGSSHKIAVKSVVGEKPLEEADFITAINRLMNSPPAPAVDRLSVKALWCELVRGRRAPSRLAEPDALIRALGLDVPATDALGGAHVARPAPFDPALVEQTAADGTAAASTEEPLVRIEAGVSGAVHGLVFMFADGSLRGTVLDKDGNPEALDKVERLGLSESLQLDEGIVRVAGRCSRGGSLAYNVVLYTSFDRRFEFRGESEDCKGEDEFDFEAEIGNEIVEVLFSGGRATGIEQREQAKDSSSRLLDALRFAAAADPRTPEELFGGTAKDATPAPLSLDQFLLLASRLGGGSAREGGQSSTDAAAERLFEELSVQVGSTAEEQKVPFEIFAVEVCPKRAPAAVARLAKLSEGLLADLRAAARSQGHNSQAYTRLLGGQDSLDEAAFSRASQELLAMAPGGSTAPPPDPVAVKALWCSFVRGRRSSQRRVDAKELAATLVGKPTSPLTHCGSLELSDDEDNDVDLSHSLTVPGLDSAVELLTPFASPVASAPPLRQRVSLDRPSEPSQPATTNGDKGALHGLDVLDSDDEADEGGAARVERIASQAFDRREHRLSLGAEALQRDAPMGDVEVVVADATKEWSGAAELEGEDDEVPEAHEAEAFERRERRLTAGAEAIQRELTAAPGEPGQPLSEAEASEEQPTATPAPPADEEQAAPTPALPADEAGVEEQPAATPAPPADEVPQEQPAPTPAPPVDEAGVEEQAARTLAPPADEVPPEQPAPAPEAGVEEQPAGTPAPRADEVPLEQPAPAPTPAPPADEVPQKEPEPASTPAPPTDEVPPEQPTPAPAADEARMEEQLASTPSPLADEVPQEQPAPTPAPPADEAGVEEQPATTPAPTTDEALQEQPAPTPAPPANEVGVEQSAATPAPPADEAPQEQSAPTPALPADEVPAEQSAATPAPLVDQVPEQQPELATPAAPADEVPEEQPAATPAPPADQVPAEQLLATPAPPTDEEQPAPTPAPPADEVPAEQSAGQPAPPADESPGEQPATTPALPADRAGVQEPAAPVPQAPATPKQEEKRAEEAARVAASPTEASVEGTPSRREVPHFDLTINDKPGEEQTPPPAPGNLPVEVSMVVHNLDYRRLASDVLAAGMLKRLVKDVVASQAGEGVRREHVTVKLRGGSVIVEASVKPPDGISSEDVKRSLRSSGLLADLLERKLQEMDGVDEILSPGCELEDISVDQVRIGPPGETDAPPTAPAAAAPAARTGRRRSSQPSEATAKDLLLKALETQPDNAVLYSELAEKLEEGERVKIKDQEYNQKDLFLKAINLDPSFGAAYSDLGTILSLEGIGTVTIQGRTYDEKDLYIKAIELDPTLALAYENLADVMSKGEKVKLGREVLDQAQVRERGQEIEGEALVAKSLGDPPRGSSRSPHRSRSRGTSVTSETPGQAQMPASPRPRDLWGAVAKDLTGGTLAEAYDPTLVAKNAAEETPSAALPSDQAQPRDLWGALAKDVASRELVETYDPDKARALETPGASRRGTQEAAEPPGFFPIRAQEVVQEEPVEPRASVEIRAAAPGAGPAGLEDSDDEDAGSAPRVERLASEAFERRERRLTAAAEALEEERLLGDVDVAVVPQASEWADLKKIEDDEGEGEAGMQAMEADAYLRRERRLTAGAEVLEKERALGDRDVDVVTQITDLQGLEDSEDDGDAARERAAAAAHARRERRLTAGAEALQGEGAEPAEAQVEEGLTDDKAPSDQAVARLKEVLKDWVSAGDIDDDDGLAGPVMTQRLFSEAFERREQRPGSAAQLADEAESGIGSRVVEVTKQDTELPGAVDLDDDEEEGSGLQVQRLASEAFERRERRLTARSEAMQQESALGDRDLDVVAQSTEWAGAKGLEEDDDDEDRVERHASEAFAQRERRLTAAAEALSLDLALGDTEVVVVPAGKEWAGEAELEEEGAEAVERHASEAFERRERRLTAAAEALGAEAITFDSEVRVVELTKEWGAAQDVLSEEEPEEEAVQRRQTEAFERRERRLTAGAEVLGAVEARITDGELEPAQAPPQDAAARAREVIREVLVTALEREALPPAIHQVAIIQQRQRQALAAAAGETPKEWAGDADDEDDLDPSLSVQRHYSEAFDRRERRLTAAAEALQRDVALGDTEVVVLPQSEEWAAMDEDEDGDEALAIQRHQSEAFDRRERRLTAGAQALEEGEVAMGDAEVTVVPQSKEWSAVEEDEDGDEALAIQRHQSEAFDRRERRLTAGAQALDQEVAFGDAEVTVVAQSKEWSAVDEDEDGDEALAIQRHQSEAFDRWERRLTAGAQALDQEVARGDAEVAVVPQSKEWAAADEEDDEGDALAVQRHQSEAFDRRERRLTAGAQALEQEVALGDAEVAVSPAAKEWAAADSDDDGGDEALAIQRHNTERFDRREQRLSAAAEALEREAALGDVEVAVVSSAKEWAAAADSDDDGDGALAIRRHETESFDRRERRLTAAAEALDRDVGLADAEVAVGQAEKEWAAAVDSDEEGNSALAIQKHQSEAFKRRERRLTAGAEALDQEVVMGDAEVVVVPQVKEWAGVADDEDEDLPSVDRHESEAYERRERRLTAGAEALEQEGALADAEVTVVVQGKEWAGAADEDDEEGDTAMVAQRHQSEAYERRERRLTAVAEEMEKDARAQEEAEGSATPSGQAPRAPANTADVESLRGEDAVADELREVALTFTNIGDAPEFSGLGRIAEAQTTLGEPLVSSPNVLRASMGRVANRDTSAVKRGASPSSASHVSMSRCSSLGDGADRLLNSGDISMLMGPTGSAGSASGATLMSMASPVAGGLGGNHAGASSSSTAPPPVSGAAMHTAVEEASDAAPPSPTSAPRAQRQRLVGRSPFLRPKDLPGLFRDMDQDGDGTLGLEDLRSYLGDYCGYGYAEAAAFHKAHAEDGGVPFEALKRHLDELDAYCVKDKLHRLIVRKPGAFGGLEGVDMHIEDCTGCTILVCDRAAELFADGLVNCRVLIGPCASSAFVRNCQGCTFWVAARQLRTRDCTECTFYVHSHTEPVIETSNGLAFAPFAAAYPGLNDQFAASRLDPTRNFWSAVYDFNGKAEGAHWRFQPLDECEVLEVAFMDCPGQVAENPAPTLCQELLVAPPPASVEFSGHSVANVPQTRPAPPPPPRRGPRRRFLSDAPDQPIEGRVEEPPDVPEADAGAAGGAAASGPEAPPAGPSPSSPQPPAGEQTAAAGEQTAAAAEAAAAAAAAAAALAQRSGAKAEESSEEDRISVGSSGDTPLTRKTVPGKAVSVTAVSAALAKAYSSAAASLSTRAAEASTSSSSDPAVAASAPAAGAAKAAARPIGALSGMGLGGILATGGRGLRTGRGLADSDDSDDERRAGRKLAGSGAFAQLPSTTRGRQMAPGRNIMATLAASTLAEGAGVGAAAAAQHRAELYRRAGLQEDSESDDDA